MHRLDRVLHTSCAAKVSEKLHIERACSIACLSARIGTGIVQVCCNMGC